MARKQSGCPLCGARVTAQEWLDGVSDVIDHANGVVSSCCPYCQGEVELRPRAGGIDIGYLLPDPSLHFEVVLSLPCDGLAVRQDASRLSLSLTAGERSWEFSS